ncbi:hypothetical protein BCL69_105511 [Nitrosomonas communis]|uniref:Uncharacterized protein n=2 Tax=Nitrosomonadaceae TaxID=206379 RepID=A0A0F7KGC0_9PROT|nr:hypothetical protein [Nitrosomonas communis]AKH38228.1 hypothetical protein AAW31_11210 [Nitrosomonas communis]TYP80665.1 hypothetical protein BCL69_105511 [Nitrosomonas communis]
MSRNKTKRGWPDTACCEDCGEYFWPVLRRFSKDVFRCHNCDDAQHKRGHCGACRGNNIPIEGHHVEMHRNNADWIVDVCLNCHAELTERQLTWSTQQSSSRELGLKDMQEIGERRRKWRERNKLTYRA